MGEILIPVSLFVCISYIIKVLSDNRVRNKLIEKGLIDENVQYLDLTRVQSQRLSALKWGLVLVGLGIALLAGQFFPPDIRNEMSVAGMLILAGIGFLSYYFIVRNMSGINDSMPDSN